MKRIVLQSAISLFGNSTVYGCTTVFRFVKRQEPSEVTGSNDHVFNCILYNDAIIRLQISLFPVVSYPPKSILVLRD